MSDITKDVAIEIITRAMPYPHQIGGWRTDLEGQLRFNWRQNTFRVSIPSLHASTIETCFEVGSDLAILCTELLRRESIQWLIEQDRKR